MAQRTRVEQRREFYELHQAGKTYAEIAAQCEVSLKCVGNGCRRQAQGLPVTTGYARPAAGPLSRFDPKVRYGVLRLRLVHPRWGPLRIGFHLAQRPALAGLALPCPAQIGQYLHHWPRFRRGLPPARERRAPAVPTAVHHCWQLDFKVGIALQDGSLVNLHTLWDPVGEACLGAVLYPAGQVGGAPKGNSLAAARATLRRSFAAWGTLPHQVQTDGESTLSAQRRWNDFPTRFTLWLLGLGIQHQVIRPGQPTDNASVERGHRTLSDYALVGNEDLTLPQLQDELDQACHELLFELPSHAKGCQGQPPIQAHPQLLKPPRPFQPDQEWARFDLQRVYAYLGGLTWQRKTSQTGQLYLGDQRYFVGRPYARRILLIRFDPADQHLIFLDPQKPEPDQEIRRIAIKGLSAAEITGLQDPTFPPGPQQLPLPLFWPSSEEAHFQPAC